MVFLIPMESASDLSLQRQGTALTPHRCAHYEGSKGVWELTPEDGGRTGARSTHSVLPTVTIGTLPPNPPEATLSCPPSTGRTMSCVTVTAWPRGSTLGWAFQSLLYSWKGYTEAKEVDGVKSCPSYVNRSIVIVFNGARLSLHGTCQKIPIPTCIFLFQDEN